MKNDVSSVDGYLDAIPEERKLYFNKLRKVIKDNLPKGFEEAYHYSMIGYVVPHSIYPDGYHCKPADPLPFMNIASQKNFVAVYNMALYADQSIMDWFVAEYPKHCSRKLDMGKSCVRFKKVEEIPFDLIGALVKKTSVKDWIKIYESKIKK